MDMKSPHLDELRRILEGEFACDLDDTMLEPSLPLGHDGLGLDSLMIVDLLARLEREGSIEADPALLGSTEGVTVQDLLRLMGSAPPQSARPNATTDPQ